MDPESSPLDAFVFERDPETDEIRVDQYYPFRVVWRLLEPEDESTGEELALPPRIFSELEEVFDSVSPWPPLWAIVWEEDDWRALWKEISLQECLSYLELVLGEHGLPFRAGDKTNFVLGNVLESFSVAQVWGMIWRAGRDAAAFYMRRGSTREHAANTVVGSIQRQAERALAEGWDLQSFRRDRRLPRSVLSEVFFGKALRTGDGGFTHVIPLESTELEDLPSSLEAQQS